MSRKTTSPLPDIFEDCPIRLGEHTMNEQNQFLL